MMEEGAPVQYVHVPKAAGTTIHSYLFDKVVNEFALPQTKLDRRNHPELCPKDDREWSGGLYWGHCPIVSGRGNTRPLFIVSLREPKARWISNFRYIARNKHHFDHNLLKAAMKLFKQRGYPTSDIFAEMLKTRHPFATSLLDRSQWSFLVPMGCPLRNGTSPKRDIVRLTRQNKDLAKAVLIQNLVRCDVVVTMDQLDTFVQQMINHLAKAQFMDDAYKFSRGGKLAGRKSPEEILDEAAVKAMTTHPVGKRSYCSVETPLCLHV